MYTLQLQGHLARQRTTLNALKITVDGLWETISKVNNMINSKEKQVNIIINNLVAESFMGGKMDNFPKRSGSGENSKVVKRHQRTGDGDMDHSAFSTEMLLDIVNS